MPKGGFVIILVVIILVAVYGGYLWGNKKGFDGGVVEGRAALLAEQKAQESLGVKIPDQANPLESVKTNPFEGIRYNPFK